ncbi:MAG: coenzyme F420-0:L-glutamate ligase [Candidatus Hodarchaeota archaeon]
MDLKPNLGKKLIIKVQGRRFARYPIKTELIKPDDDVVEIVTAAVKKYAKPGDIVIFSEKATAVAQNRAFHKDEVKVSKLAKFLSKFTTKSEKGIGISSPETFQLALDDCGTLRILVASFCAAITRPFGIKGVFYYVAGEKAALIDGAADYVCPPYNKYVSLGPENCQELCEKISANLGGKVKVYVVDINDYGGRVVQKGSHPIDKKLITEIMIDNPLGQSKEMTPVGILRELRIKN